MFVYKNKNKSLILVLFLIIIILFLVFFYIYNNYYSFLKNDIVISEICTHNSNSVQDYYGCYSDYVELYNNSEDVIDLSNYYLSDDKHDRFKMLLPNYMIKPGEYYVIFLNKYITKFKLSDEESIYLSHKSGKMLKEISIPLLKKDESYSLRGDDIYEISFPTPRCENFIEVKNTILNEKHLDSIIEVSNESGFYDKPFYLKLSSNDDNLTIYYTLDSTEPNINSTKYDKPILIYDNSNDVNLYASIDNIATNDDYVCQNKVNKCTILRAIGIDKDGNKTEEIIKSYFINYMNKEGYNNLPTVSLITNPDNLFDYENGIYVKGKAYDDYIEYSKLKINDKSIFELDNLYIPEMPANYLFSNNKNKKKAYVSYFNGEQNSFDEVEISIHGVWTRSFNQKSFNLFKVDDNSSFLFSLFGDCSSLVLRNGGNDAYVTKICDVINQQLFNDRNVLTQDYVPVQLFLDGEYWGLYMLQERVDKEYISRKTNIDVNNIILIKKNNVIDNEQALYLDFEELKNYIMNNDMSIDKNYNYVKEKMDVQSYIDLRCFEIYANRNDGTNNNFNNIGIWKSIEKGESKFEDNKYRFILYDTESRASDDIDLINEKMFLSLLKNEKFKKQFVISYMDTINYNFDYEKIHELINDLSTKIELSFVENNKRFFDDKYSLTTYQKKC